MAGKESAKMESQVYVIYGLETSEAMVVEMTAEQFLAWSDDWVEEMGLGEIEEGDA